MTTIQISDPWFENLYNQEFGANPAKFIETIKSLLVERYQKEKRVIFLLHQYKDSEISIGKIAENLNIDGELDLRLIIDEKTGRKIAKEKGVKIIGLLGILEANFRLEFISYRELLYMLEDFKRVDYRLSHKLERAFLEGLNR